VWMARGWGSLGRRGVEMTNNGESDVVKWISELHKIREFHGLVEK